MSTNSQVILNGLLQDRRNETQPETSPDTFFEIFVGQEVLKDFDLSYDEIESGLVGNGGDGGIDGIYLFVNGDLVQEDSEYSHLAKGISIELLVIQAKTHPGFQETPVDRFITVSKDLFDLTKGSSLDGLYNQSLTEGIRRFQALYQELASRLPALAITFVYASKGSEVDDKIKHKVQMLKEEVASYFPNSTFNFQFLGAPELLELASQQPTTTRNLPLAENPISSDNQVGFVCLVKLADFFAFITDSTEALQRHLFEANVRDYQGRTEVNDEIQGSLSSNTGEDFWWLNNGISILATEASLGGKTLTVRDPQIVNGLQTSTEIYNYCKGGQLDAEWRKILVKVMVSKEDESRDRVIKATNSQTVVPLASLRATDKIQRDIEEYLRQSNLYYDRRKNYYKNEGKPRDKIVGIPYLAQAVMAIVLRKPDQARARPSSLLKSSADYEQVFNISYPIHLYYVCAEAMRRVEAALKSSNLDVASEDRNNLRFYIGMHAVAGLSNKPKPTPHVIANFDPSSLDETKVKLSLDIVRPKYLELGGSDQTAKGPSLIKALLEETP